LKVSPELERIVHRCLRKAPADRFQTMGEIRAALQQVRPEEGRPYQEQPAHEQPAQGQPSIAVLPFSNMSADKENEYFSDGLAEEILNSLVRIPGLKVTARTSSFAFRGKEQDIRGIAEALDVRTILEGSVRRAGNRVRVTAQLINAADGYHLWSERYDREMTDVFEVQDEIAAAIAGALKLKLSGDVAPVHRHQPNLPAYEAFLKGRHCMLKSTPEAWARGEAFLQQAIALDSRFAEPHTQLAAQYFVLWANGLRPAQEMVPLIRAEARKAVDLLDDSGHSLLGVVAAGYDYDWKEAQIHFQIALGATQAPPEMIMTYAMFFLTPSGRLQEAVTLMEQTVAMDPLNLLLRGHLAMSLMTAEMYDRGIEEALKCLEIDDTIWVPFYSLIAGYAAKGMVAEARTAAEKAYNNARWNPRITGIFAGILALAGERERATALLGEMSHSAGSLVAPTGRVLYHLILGEIDAAADWFEKAVEQRDPLLVPWIRLPLAKPIRASPRWPKIAAMMNLPESMSQHS